MCADLLYQNSPTLDNKFESNGQNLTNTVKQSITRSKLIFTKQTASPSVALENNEFIFFFAKMDGVRQKQWHNFS
jgi:hypothetical protein